MLKMFMSPKEKDGKSKGRGGEGKERLRWRDVPRTMA